MLFFEEEKEVWMHKECDEHGKFKGFIEKDVNFYKKMMNNKGETASIRTVIVPITHKCNLECKFCFVPKRGLKEKTTNELKDEIRKVMN